MDRTPEEFPNNIKNPYNQLPTPNKFGGYAQVTPLELFNRP